MNRYYLQLVNFVSDTTTNLESLMMGEQLVFDQETAMEKDAIYKYLLQPWEHDDKVIVYLEVILPALGELAKRIFKDHLPGGRLEHRDKRTRSKSSSSQKQNELLIFGPTFTEKSEHISIIE